MARITCKNLKIIFPIYENNNRSLKNTMLRSGLVKHGLERENDGVQGLENICFTISEGERVGLVGHNGSGKTTLLRVLSGIYHPTRGCLTIEGRTASLLDLSSGFDPDATGYENIFLRSLLFGKKKHEILSLIEDIISFSQLEKFIYMPVRTYSSGMTMRLAFSIATAVRPEILLMDEWLSVGDANFNERATARLKSMVDQANILVIASHDERIIQEMCTRVITLENGKIISDEINA
jgi:lipopolysaccharide transport system ATP-binding protein